MEELDWYLVVMVKIVSDEELVFVVLEVGVCVVEVEMEVGRMGMSASGRRRASDTSESDELLFVLFLGGLGMLECYVVFGKNMMSFVSLCDVSVLGVSVNLVGDFGRMTVGSS